jgi:hypothetical protein
MERTAGALPAIRSLIFKRSAAALVASARSNFLRSGLPLVAPSAATRPGYGDHSHPSQQRGLQPRRHHGGAGRSISRACPISDGVMRDPLSPAFTRRYEQRVGRTTVRYVTSGDLLAPGKIFPPRSGARRRRAGAGIQIRRRRGCRARRPCARCRPQARCGANALPAC